MNLPQTYFFKHMQNISNFHNAFVNMRKLDIIQSSFNLGNDNMNSLSDLSLHALWAIPDEFDINVRKKISHRRNKSVLVIDLVSSVNGRVVPCTIKTQFYRQKGRIFRGFTINDGEFNFGIDGSDVYETQKSFAKPTGSYTRYSLPVSNQIKQGIIDAKNGISPNGYSKIMKCAKFTNYISTLLNK